jgi:hypothetical protein
MALIDNITTLEQVFRKLTFNDKRIFETLESVHTDSFNTFWFNGKFTPNELAAKYGTDATAWFMASAKIQDLLQIVKPTYIRLTPPEKYQITFNEDGSVVITDTTIQPEETPRQ